MKNSVEFAPWLRIMLLSAISCNAINMLSNVSEPQTTIVDKIDSKPSLVPQDLSSVDCYLDAGMILMIPKSVSNQTRQDILYSMLLFELAADEKHNRATDLSEWLKLFDSSALCYAGELASFWDIAVKESQFTIADIAPQEMARDKVFATHVPTYKQILGVLKKLPATSSTIQSLQNKTYDPSTHDTTVIFATLDQDVTLTLLVIGLTGVKDASSNTLFHPYKTKEVKSMKGGIYRYIFDPDCYPKHRQEIIDKLGPAKVQDYITKVNLPEIL